MHKFMELWGGRLWWAQGPVLDDPPLPRPAPTTAALYPVCRQPSSGSCHSHILMAPALLSPADGMG